MILNILINLIIVIEILNLNFLTTFIQYQIAQSFI